MLRERLLGVMGDVFAKDVILAEIDSV